MKHMLTMSRTANGFALPTILIASVVMLIVLMSAVTAVTSSSSLLSNQYYNELAREAAESGLANAKYCLGIASYSPSWTDALPLKPDKDCNGAALGAGYSQYVVNNGNVRSTFTVLRPQVASASSLRIVSTGTVQLVRGSDSSQVWRTYTTTAAVVSRYNDTPQIAGGAGWKTSQGHDGYMLAGTGVLYGWGDNGGGQLGDASLGTTISKPIKMALPNGVSRVRKVFNSGQGASIVCIIATNETLGDQAYCRGTGLNLSGSGWQRFGLGAGLTAKDMVINGFGNDSACAIASDGDAYCVGNNDFGQLGAATTSAAYVPITSPVQFRLDLASPGPVSGSAASLTVLKVYNQDVFTCVIASDNQSYCAGWNVSGQLGQGTTTVNVAGLGKSIPGRSIIPGAPAVTDIRLPYHANGSPVGVFYQVANGNIYMSGTNTQGTANSANFSDTFSTPHLMTSGNYTKMVSIGEQGNGRHTFCIINDDNAVVANSGLWCVGANGYGQLGLGLACSMADANNTKQWSTASTVGGERVTSSLNIEANYQMNSLMVITTTGNVYAAGDNTYGKLGTGAALGSCYNTFSKVQLPAGVKGVAVANGDEYSAFILGDNGKVYGMGRNDNGQLGDGTTTNRPTPVEVQIPRQETIF